MMTTTLLLSIFLSFQAVVSYCIGLDHGWLDLYAFLLLLAGVLLKWVCLVVAARATVMTILMLLAFSGKRGRVLGYSGEEDHGRCGNVLANISSLLLDIFRGRVPILFTSSFLHSYLKKSNFTNQTDIDRQSKYACIRKSDYKETVIFITSNKRGGIRNTNNKFLDSLPGSRVQPGVVLKINNRINLLNLSSCHRNMVGWMRRICSIFL